MSIDRARVAEVLVYEAGQSVPERSSGYLVRDRHVLTSAHALRGCVESVDVRFGPGEPGQWTTRAVVIWLNHNLDVAVLRITRSVSAAVPDVRFGAIAAPVADCEAAGFPLFSTGDPGRVAASAACTRVSGPGASWSGERSGALGMSVTVPGSSPDPKRRSPWEGMAGAAVFHTDSGLLVGIIREHHPSEADGRLTATTVAHWYAELARDDLAVLGDLIGLPPERAMLEAATSRGRSDGPAIAPEVVSAATRSYLAWVTRENSRLTVTALASSRTTMQIDLERVYVQLKVDFSSQDEREAARINRWRELTGDMAAPDLLTDDDPGLSWQLADRQPTADLLDDLSWSAAARDDLDKALTIGDLYGRADASVILGDPGSGKTTIARWLALLHAKALHGGDSVVRVPTATIDVSARGGQFTSLGPPLLPILVRVAEYADDRERTPPRTRPRTLLEFLGHAWAKSPPTWQREDVIPPYRAGLPIPPEILAEVFNDALDEQRALVLLDGLDEVPRYERLATADAVSDFINTWIRAAPPGHTANKVIATSRIAGYRDAPLPADLTQVTIQPMTEAALAEFLRGRLTEVLAEFAAQQGLPADPLAGPDAAQGLLNMLDEPENRYVRGLATNPLLAGVIVSVFIDQGHTLPRQRVELYEWSVTTLTDVWRSRLTGTYSPQIARDVFSALPAVAVYIHDTKPTGVIGADEFRQRMLAEMSRLSPQTPEQTRLDAVESLRNVMEEDLGLLVASGPDAFRFAHRSFQEYLAAQHLIADPSASAGQILARLGDSQWREPILMAIGLMNWRHSAAMPVFTQTLLAQDGPLSEFFPETALLLAAAIPQMAGVPSQVVRQTAGHILTRYSTLFRERRMPEVRELLTTALATLRDTAYAPDADAVLIAALRQPPDGDFAAACAAGRLIRDIGAASPELAMELMEAAMVWDSADFGSPITEALGLLVSPQRLPKDGEAQPRLPASAWGDTELALRDTLRTEIALVERIRSDPPMLSVITALYGGYWNLGAASDLDEYERLSGYLRLDEPTRREFAVYYASRYRDDIFGSDDPVMSMLMTRRAERKDAARRFAASPVFNHEAITRDSAFTTRIIEALDRGKQRGLPTLTRVLRASLAPGNGNSRARADALVALWALGEPVEAELADRAADPARALAARRIAALVPGLADATVRAGQQAGQALAAAAGRLPDETWEQLGGALTKILHHAGASPVSLFTERDRIPQRCLPRVLTEEIAQTVGGWGDRPKDQAERLTSSGDEFPFSLIMEALCGQGSAWSNGYRRYSYWWPTDPLAFPPDGTKDIPLAVLDQIAALPAGMTHIFQWLRELVYRTVGEDNPVSMLELGVIVYARVRGTDEIDLALLASLDEFLARIPQFTETMFDEASQLPDPWLSARSLLRIGELFPAQRHQALRAAERTAADVSDPVRAFQVHERLALLGPAAEHPTRAAICRNLALSIADPALAARALLRITRLVPVPDIEDLMSAAASQIIRVDGRASQLELLRLASEMFPDRPGCQAVISGLLRDIGATGDERAHVAGNWGDVVAEHLPVLCGDREALIQALVPVVLYGRAIDLVRTARRDEVTAAWAALRIHPSAETVQRLLDTHPGQFILCTGPVMRSLDEAVSVVGVRFLEPVLSRLVRVSHDAEPTVRRWLGHHAPHVGKVAALLLAERHRLTEDTVALVAGLLCDDDDLLRSRARACIAPGPITVQMSVSTVGAVAVTTLAEFAHEHRDDRPGMTAVSGWYVDRLLHDDPAALSAWCDEIELAGTSSAAAGIVRGVTWLSTHAWNLLLDRLRHGSPALQETILLAVSWMLFTGTDNDGDFHAVSGALRINSGRWDQLYQVLRAIDAEPLYGAAVLPIQVDDVFNAVDNVLARAEDAPDRASSMAASSVAAGRELRKAETSFGEILATTEEAEVRKHLYQVGNSMMIPTDSGLMAYLAARDRRRRSDRVNGPWTGVLRAWAGRLINENVGDPTISRELEYVLEALSGAARYEPESFRGDVDRRKLSEQLAHEGRYHPAYRARAAACHLLGLLRYGSPDVFRALRDMLDDSSVDVRRAALGAIVGLRSVDRRLINDLSKALSGESVTVAWAAAQLLAVIGENTTTPKPVRDEIIGRLAAAVRDPRSRRTVHFAFADTAMPDMPELDDVFTGTLRQVYRLG